MNAPITLTTPGKADVVVTILADTDQYEICFVGDVGFYDLATPLYDLVDWKLRAGRGADGAPPPHKQKRAAEAVNAAAGAATASSPAAAGGAEVKAVLDLAGVEGLGPGAVVLDFGASWCKNCDKIKPFVDQLAAKIDFAEVTFATVDIEEAEDELIEEYSVSNVPHFVILKGGKKVAEYKGSKDAELESAITAAFV